MGDLDLTEAVEAAAQAVRDLFGDDGWLNTGHDWDHERAIARAAVEAAAPLIAAQERAECGRWTTVLDGVDSPCVRPAGHTSECHPEVHAASGRPTVADLTAGDLKCNACGRHLNTRGCRGETLQGERVRVHLFVPTRQGMAGNLNHAARCDPLDSDNCPGGGLDACWCHEVGERGGRG